MRHRLTWFEDQTLWTAEERLVKSVEIVDLDTGSTIAWPADQPIERQVRRP